MTEISQRNATIEELFVQTVLLQEISNYLNMGERQDLPDDIKIRINSCMAIDLEQLISRFTRLLGPQKELSYDYLENNIENKLIVAARTDIAAIDHIVLLIAKHLIAEHKVPRPSPKTEIKDAQFASNKDQ
jgi:hypothetical protein